MHKKKEREYPSNIVRLKSKVVFQRFFTKGAPGPCWPFSASESPPPALASPSGVAGSGSGVRRIGRLSAASATSLETGSARAVHLVAAPPTKVLLVGRSGRPSAASVAASPADRFRHTALDPSRPVLSCVITRFLCRALTSLLLRFLFLTSFLVDQRLYASRLLCPALGVSS